MNGGHLQTEFWFVSSFGTCWPSSTHITRVYKAAENKTPSCFTPSPPASLCFSPPHTHTHSDRQPALHIWPIIAWTWWSPLLLFFFLFPPRNNSWTEALCPQTHLWLCFIYLCATRLSTHSWETRLTIAPSACCHKASWSFFFFSFFEHIVFRGLNPYK